MKLLGIIVDMLANAFVFIYDNLWGDLPNSDEADWDFFDDE